MTEPSQPKSTLGRGRNRSRIHNPGLGGRGTRLPILVLLLALGLSAPASVEAQMPPEDRHGTFFGPIVGLNFSTYSGVADIDVGSQPGLKIGGFLHIPITRGLAVRSELLYSEKGVPFDETDFLEVPVLLVGVVRLDRVTSAHFMFGGSTGVPLKDPDGVVFGTGLASTGPCGGRGCGVLGVPPEPNTDFALVVGGGASVDIGDRSVFVDLRYDMGMRGIHSFTPLKSRVLTFSVGLGLPFGR